MNEIFNTIYRFLSKVGIPVYPENGVPTGAVLPYLTWSPVQTDWDSDGLMPVRIWDRSPNYKSLAQLADSLAGLLGEYAILPTDSGGYIHLYRGDPWCQTQPMQDTDVKAMTDVKVLYINIGISTML